VAQALCNPGDTTWASDGSSAPRSEFDGTQLYPVATNLTTVQGNVTYYRPYVDFAHQGDVSAWVLMHPSACASTQGLAQVGQAEYVMTGGADTTSFYEVENCHVTPVGPVEYYTSPGSAHTYTVNHAASGSPGNYNYALYIDGGSPIHSGHVNWGNADLAQFEGETHAPDDQQYGANTVWSKISSTQACDYVGGYTCQNPITTGNNFPQNDEPAWWLLNVVQSTGNVYIGDNRCST
jgi:hypothetical protein